MSTAIYSHTDCQRHEMGDWHPESPARLQAISDQLILAHINDLLEHREAPLAQLADIERVHSKNAIGLVRDHIPAPGHYYPLDGDTLLNAHSWNAALRAAGAAVAATDAVIDGELDNAFCATRPPGHHARPSEPMGFCLFNNVAVAARHALDARGLERIAIVDFDVHHGNGTAEALARDPRALMVSFFQHPFYPFSDVEPYTDNCVNVPVPARSKGDVVRQLVLDHWLPALHRHRPQMLFISAGFDAHREDDVGDMGLVEADYAWITRQVMAVARLYAGGRIVSCLEGGYNLSALGRSVAAHVRALAELD
ncbi:histone deacetylase family protein [Janthinobacterium fluminis]|uniref:Histone deacetylase family protein n=1 Tax=Janthinobacterium fluminis TaxID=2987524 RepID=A0ABT5JXT8_9BURK|nr:histone deacetylase family protein [Janthinobacterium fluminis]MDC8757548.1 histone deacetylase family protein [Janthinobacterium fluminis]